MPFQYPLSQAGIDPIRTTRRRQFSGVPPLGGGNAFQYPLSEAGIAPIRTTRRRQFSCIPPLGGGNWRVGASTDTLRRSDPPLGGGNALSIPPLTGGNRPDYPPPACPNV
jgi:hypothetical protein